VADRRPGGEVIREGGADVGVQSEARLPGGARIAVERGRRGGAEVAGEAARRVGRDQVGSPRRADQAVDHVVGQQGRHACAAAERERARGGQGELAVDRCLGVVARGEGGRALPRHHHGQAVGRRRRTDGGEEVARHDDLLVDLLTGDLHLGETDRRRGQGRRGVVGRGVDGDAHGVKGGGGEVDHLARRHVRRRVERERAPVGAVEGDRRPLDPAGTVAPLWLYQRQVVGGDRRGEPGLPPLAGRIGDERAGDPGRVEVAVDRAVGAVLGCVRDGVAVAAGRHRDGAYVACDCAGGERGPGEEVDGAVAEVTLGRIVRRSLGRPGVGAQGVPAEGLLAVGVGHHQLGAGRGKGAGAGGVTAQRPRVVERAARVEQAKAGQVVQARGVARHDHRPLVRLRP